MWNHNQSEAENQRTEVENVFSKFSYFNYCNYCSLPQSNIFPPTIQYFSVFQLERTIVPSHNPIQYFSQLRSKLEVVSKDLGSTQTELASWRNWKGKGKGGGKKGKGKGGGKKGKGPPDAKRQRFDVGPGNSGLQLQGPGPNGTLTQAEQQLEEVDWKKRCESMGIDYNEL